MIGWLKRLIALAMPQPERVEVAAGGQTHIVTLTNMESGWRAASGKVFGYGNSKEEALAGIMEILSHPC